MAICPMFGEEETQRQQELRIRRQREARAAARAKFRQQLVDSARKTFFFLFGATVVLYLVINAGRFQEYSTQVGHKLSAKVNAHSNLKQSALKYQDEVDQITK